MNFGDGAYGIGAAAQHYFGVPAAKLTVPQAALLVGILKCPTNYNPVDNPESLAGRAATSCSRACSRPAASTDATHDRGDGAPDRAERSPTRCRAAAASAYPFFCQWAAADHRDRPGVRRDARGAGQTCSTAAASRSAPRSTARAMAAAQTGGHARARGEEPGRDRHRGRAARHRRRCVAHRDEPHVGPQQGEGADADRCCPRDRRTSPARTSSRSRSRRRSRSGFSLTTRSTPRRLQARAMNYPQGGFHNDNDRNNGVLDAYQATAALGEHLVHPARGAATACCPWPTWRSGSASRACRARAPRAITPQRRVADPRRLRGVAAGDGRRSTRRSPAAASPAPRRDHRRHRPARHGAAGAAGRLPRAR